MPEDDEEAKRQLRQEMREKLRWVAQGGQSRFGDKKSPMLVSLRASNPKTLLGHFITILNVGINDENVEGLGEILNDEALAYQLYVKLIQDFLVDIVPPGGEEETRRQILDFREVEERVHREEFFGETIGRDAELQFSKARLKAYKEYFKEIKGREFPQDPYEQLEWVAYSVSQFPRAGAKVVLSKELTAVMVQKMSYGCLPNSISGTVTSRNPLTGEKLDVCRIQRYHPD